MKLKLALSPGFVAAGHLPVSQELHNPCGSEPAREEGFAVNITVD
ncbi:hypothetical protein [Pseudomonas fluorescens]|nr:hypothetical protein [Pseudomonas fluorescens]